MSTNDLREKIAEILEEWGEDKEDRGVASAYGRYVDLSEPREIADRILSLLPKMPELRWDGRVLRIGAIAVGRVGKEDDGRYYGNWLHDEDGYFTDDVNDDIFAPTESEARAAVEKAVREAMGIE